MDGLYADDKRRDVIRSVVAYRYGSYDPSRERLVETPNWEVVFSLNACTNCNPLAQNMGKLMPSGESLECRVCHIRIPNELFESARKSHETEKTLMEKQDKLDEKLEKYGIKGEQLEKIIKIAEDRADAEARKKQTLEESLEKPESGGREDETA